MRRRGTITMLAVLGAALAAAAPPAAGAASTAARLDAALARIVVSPAGPPGVSVLIDRGGRSEFHRRGVANVVTGRRPSPADPVRIASVSKAFSGAVALSLVQEGRLSLDSTVGELLPGLMPQADAVTLRQVLGHTGGLPDYIRRPALLALLRSDPRAYRTPRQLIAFVKGVPLRFAPGTRYEYSDTDNIIAALMAEQATGRSYEELLQERISGPLGLRSTSLPRTVAMPARFMHGYDVAPGRRPEDVSRLVNPALAWASGGIVSAPRDVGAFLRAYVGGRLFDRPDLRDAQRRFMRGAESSPPGPGRNASGLALFRYRTRCGTVYGHTGSFPGYRLFGASTADGRDSVVFTVNAQSEPGGAAAAERKVSRQIRAAQALAVCRALGR